MNVALIIAAGVGARMGQDIPKQFLPVYEKPVIVYTMEAFQNHPQIDEIVISCLEGWETPLWAYAKQFGIAKLKMIVPGGKTGQESIYNGISALSKDHSDEDIILIHDAIRPYVSAKIISDCISTTIEKGNAVTIIPCNEVMLTTEDSLSSNAAYDRDKLKRTQTPQTVRLGKLIELHKMAKGKGITNSVATCSLMTELGETVYFCDGSSKNIKLTTVDDIDIFKALLNAKRPEWIKG